MEIFILKDRRTALIYEGKLFPRLNVGQMVSQIRVVWDMGQFV